MSGVLALVAVLAIPISLLLGIVALVWATPRWLEYRSVGRFSPFASQAPGRAALKGTVRAAAEGTIECPLSGQPAVYARVKAKYAMIRIRYGDTVWLDGLESVSAVPFLIEDEAGDRALVRVGGARFDLEQGHIPVNAREAPRTPERVLPFLRARVPASLDAEFQARLAKRSDREAALGLTYEEERIGPGDEVWIIGAATRPSGETEPPQAPLEVSAPPGGELLVTVTDPSVQARSYGQAFVFGVVSLSVGIGLVVLIGLTGC